MTTTRAEHEYDFDVDDMVNDADIDCDNSSDGGQRTSHALNGTDVLGSDSDTVEMKQRKKEMIMARQMERRKQQELIRLKREEERARKADELRQKEEELNQKKLLEKARKETIFQAYIDKKKQLETESQQYQFGPPHNSLLNAKRFHSTQRLRAKTSSNLLMMDNSVNSLQAAQQFDQISLYSERSNAATHQPQGSMVKSKCLFRLFCFCFVLLLLLFDFFVSILFHGLFEQPLFEQPLFEQPTLSLSLSLINQTKGSRH